MAVKCTADQIGGAKEMDVHPIRRFVEEMQKEREANSQMMRELIAQLATLQAARIEVPSAPPAPPPVSVKLGLPPAKRKRITVERDRSGRIETLYIEEA